MLIFILYTFRSAQVPRSPHVLSHSFLKTNSFSVYSLLSFRECSPYHLSSSYGTSFPSFMSETISHVALISSSPYHSFSSKCIPSSSPVQLSDNRSRDNQMCHTIYLPDCFRKQPPVRLYHCRGKYSAFPLQH